MLAEGLDLLVDDLASSGVNDALVVDVLAAIEPLKPPDGDAAAAIEAVPEEKLEPPAMALAWLGASDAKIHRKRVSAALAHQTSRGVAPPWISRAVRRPRTTAKALPILACVSYFPHSATGPAAAEHLCGARW